MSHSAERESLFDAADAKQVAERIIRADENMPTERGVPLGWVNPDALTLARAVVCLLGSGGPRTFTMYRRGDLSATHDSNQANPPDEPQFEGVVFSDGRCALRWLTPKGSVSVWDSLDDALAIHGHPEYDSELVWHRTAE